MKLDNESIDKKSFSFRDLVGQKSEWTPRQNPRNVTASTNSNFLDDVVRVDCTAGAVTITLETAVACDGRQHTFKKIDASANAMIVDGTGSETIDGAATLSTAVRYMTYVIKSNGTNWDLISAAVTSAPGTVTSVAETFTGGIISVAGSPITTSGTLALTVAGTSGGVPYFSSGTAWASSGALAQGGIVVGGGAGASPASVTAGATTEILVGGGANTAPVWTTASGSGAPVRATSPALTTPSLGVASATSINFGQEALNTYDEFTWTPVDSSGAGLSLTVVADGCYGVKIGRSGSVSTDIAYPATVNTADTKIGGIPFTTTDSTNDTGGGHMSNSNFGAGLVFLFNNNATTMQIYRASGGVVNNITASGQYYRATLPFIAAS